jgi:hypothetical protein
MIAAAAACDRKPAPRFPMRPARPLIFENEPMQLRPRWSGHVMTVTELYYYHAARGTLWKFFAMFPPS